MKLALPKEIILRPQSSARKELQDADFSLAIEEVEGRRIATPFPGQARCHLSAYELAGKG